jgi:hypothetical protein
VKIYAAVELIQASIDANRFLPFSVHDVVDGRIVVLAPEERNGVEMYPLPKNALGSSLDNNPMFDANLIIGVRVRPSGDHKFQE